MSPISVSCNLKNLVRDRGTHGLLSAEIFCLTTQVLNALSHLEAQNLPIVHGNVRPECLLIAGEGETIQTKLFDLGRTMSGNKGCLMALEEGCVHFIAPEVLQMRAGLLTTETPLTPRTDVWSLGATLLAVLLDINVRYGGFDACRRLLNGSWKFEDNLLSQPWWSGSCASRWAVLDDRIRRMVQQSLVVSPDRRLFASQLLPLLRPLAAAGHRVVGPAETPFADDPSRLLPPAPVLGPAETFQEATVIMMDKAVFVPLPASNISPHYKLRLQSPHLLCVETLHHCRSRWALRCWQVNRVMLVAHSLSCNHPGVATSCDSCCGRRCQELRLDDEHDPRRARTW